ncbi:MFS transporter [Robinsoniella peoriensis]|uniref:MFS transporter n=1 Tax=Robinsoniella peoriensis TaxID=180332 RepID=UPI0036424E74
MGFMNAVYGWYLLAIPYAMGATILVSLLGPILINRWFSKKAGMMMGIQMAFVGLFGAVFQPVTSNIISQRGWRSGYIYIGGATFIVVILTALILLKNRPEEKKQCLMEQSISSLHGRRQISRRQMSRIMTNQKGIMRQKGRYMIRLKYQKR